MRSVNKVFLYGNLGQDPEKRSTRGGKDVTIFSLATHRSIKEEDGYRNETDWHRVVAFDWMAREAIVRLRKGYPVAVVGTLRPKKWTDTEGVTRKRVEIYAENLCFGPLKPPVSELPLPQDAGTTVPALPEGTVSPDKESSPLPEKGRWFF